MDYFPLCSYVDLIEDIITMAFADGAKIIQQFYTMWNRAMLENLSDEQLDILLAIFGRSFCMGRPAAYRRVYGDASRIGLPDIDGVPKIRCSQERYRSNIVERLIASNWVFKEVTGINTYEATTSLKINPEKLEESGSEVCHLSLLDSGIYRENTYDLVEFLNMEILQSILSDRSKIGLNFTQVKILIHLLFISLVIRRPFAYLSHAKYIENEPLGEKAYLLNKRYSRNISEATFNRAIHDLELKNVIFHYKSHDFIQKFLTFFTRGRLGELQSPKARALFSMAISGTNDRYFLVGAEKDFDNFRQIVDGRTPIMGLNVPTIIGANRAKHYQQNYVNYAFWAPNLYEAITEEVSLSGEFLGAKLA